MSNFSLHLPADVDYLQLARNFSKEVCLFLTDYTCDPDFLNDVELATSEACTNAMTHGKKRKITGQIILNIKVSPEKFMIRVMDQGKGFDLDKIPIPKGSSPQENGWGIFIIKLKMDTVEYQRGKDWNTLTMEKYYSITNLTLPRRNSYKLPPNSPQD